MPKRKKTNKGALKRINGHYRRPERPLTDDEEETFVVHDVDGIRTNDEGNVSFIFYLVFFFSAIY